MTRQAPLTCVHCGEPITAYGPEVFHAESTLIRCANEQGTRATKEERA